MTLWIDDSLSMLTHEEHGTRLAEGLAQVRALLTEVPHANVDIRTLGDPWHSLGSLTEATSRPSSLAPDGSRPSAPPAALLPDDRLHWLLTDGAHARCWNGPARAAPIASSRWTASRATWGWSGYRRGEA
jgi:hypothetical protein